MPADCSFLLCTRNEARHVNFEFVLSWYQRFQWFKEHLALDDSTDETPRILEKYGFKVLRNPKCRTLADGRNWLQSQAAYDWVYHSDADELLDWNFLNNLEHWLQAEAEDEKVAYSFPRINQPRPGREVAWKDYQTRLLNRRYVEWGYANPNEPAHTIAVIKSTKRPADAPVRRGDKLVFYTQRLDYHPILHLPRPLTEDATVQERWRTTQDLLTH